MITHNQPYRRRENQAQPTPPFRHSPKACTVAAQRTPTTHKHRDSNNHNTTRLHALQPQRRRVRLRTNTPPGCESWHHRPRRCVTGPSPRPARQGTWHSETPKGVSSADPAAPGDESGTFQPQPTRHQAQHTPMKTTLPTGKGRHHSGAASPG